MGGEGAGQAQQQLSEGEGKSRGLGHQVCPPSSHWASHGGSWAVGRKGGPGGLAALLGKSAEKGRVRVQMGGDEKEEGGCTEAGDHPPAEGGA